MWGPGEPCHAALLLIAFRAFETQMTRLEAEFVRREAPPSYGQLIAQGLIPPVEDFPIYSASQVSAREHATPQAPGSRLDLRECLRGSLRGRLDSMQPGWSRGQRRQEVRPGQVETGWGRGECGRRGLDHG